MTNSIFHYTDYPSYLGDWVQTKMSSGHGFSYRNFSIKAGISTENYLKLVIEKKKKLGLKLCEQFVNALGLKKTEADYFRALVGLDLSISLDAKQTYLEKMEALRRQAGSNGRKDYLNSSFHRHWYWAVIWELASCKDFDLTPTNIVRALKEKITIKQAKAAVDYLMSQNLLVKENGKWTQTPLKIASTNGVEDVYLQANHKKMSLLAAKTLDLPLSDRTFQGLTIAIDPTRMPEVKKELIQIIRGLQEKFSDDPYAKAVYRFNLQCFPVAKV